MLNLTAYSLYVMIMYYVCVYTDYFSAGMHLNNFFPIPVFLYMYMSYLSTYVCIVCDEIVLLFVHIYVSMCFHVCEYVCMTLFKCVHALLR